PSYRCAPTRRARRCRKPALTSQFFATTGYAVHRPNKGGGRCMAIVWSMRKTAHDGASITRWEGLGPAALRETGRASDEQSKGDQPQGVYVGSRGRRLGAALLGRPILGGPDQLVPTRGTGADVARQAEVHDLGTIVVVDHDVRGFEIAVDDSLGVRGLES